MCTKIKALASECNSAGATEIVLRSSGILMSMRIEQAYTTASGHGISYTQLHIKCTYLYDNNNTVLRARLWYDHHLFIR